MDSPANNAQSESIPEAVSRTLAEGSVAALATLIAGGANAQAHVGAKLMIPEAALVDAQIGSLGGLGNRALDSAVKEHAALFLQSKVETRVFQVKDLAPALDQWAEAQILFERIQQEPRLVICGAGHVGASLARLASLMGYRATLIDDRTEFVTRDRFPEEQIELVAAANWTEAVRAAVGNGHSVSVAIVTRGHSEDEQCLRAIIAADLEYVGMIGSKRRTKIVLQRLRESGAAEETLEKVKAPIGLDIGAVTPEEVALAIMAEIVAVRRGGKGGSLSACQRDRTRNVPNPRPIVKRTSQSSP